MIRTKSSTEHNDRVLITPLDYNFQIHEEFGTALNNNDKCESMGV